MSKSSTLLPPGALPLGLGAMRLPGEEGIEIVHRALDAGVRLLDTADVYGSEPNANEKLLARALASWSGPREQVIVATKGGLVRRGSQFHPDGRARHLKAACEASLLALGIDSIDLYQLHAPDPGVPFARSLRALEALVREGKVRRVGLSNVGLEELERACGILEVVSLQVALSPLDLTPLKSGVAAFCAERGIAILAHSPLGGHRARGRIEKESAIRRLAERRSATPQEIALAWLAALHPGIHPIPGASRLESVASIVRAGNLRLTADELSVLGETYPASKYLRVRRRAPAPGPVTGDGEVVLFVGYPGAGKSTLSEGWVERGYQRLNRDLEGGGLSRVAADLDRRLSRGERRLVLDNTYPRRASRFEIIETASRYRVPVTCVWLQTSLEEAQVNAAERMVRRYGRLLTPEEMAASSRKDPNSFPPSAQFRFRRQLEPPRIEEGFQRIEQVAFERKPSPDRMARALLFEYDSVIRRTRSGAPRPSSPEDVELLPNRREVLARYAKEGYRLLGVSYQPDVSSERALAGFQRTSELLGLEIEVQFCPHPAGPAICWCRKPLPGLGVLLIEKHGIDPKRSLMVVASPADRGFAGRLRISAVEPGELFGSY